MNQVKQWIEYAPTGIATLPGAKNKREQLGKVLLGSLFTYFGALLAAEDKTTWDSPTDPTAKQLFYASGRKPFSVNIKGKWIPMWYFGPFAFALALPAAVKHYHEQSRTALTDSEIEKITQATGDLVKFVMSQSPLSGLNAFGRFIQGDIDYSIARNLGFTASQIIPFTGLLNYIADVLDPIYRRPSGFIESIKSGIPGMTEEIEPYTEPSGELSRREPINYLLPYDIGIPRETMVGGTRIEEALRQRQEKLQMNAVINKTKQEIERKKAGQQQIGNTFVFWDKDEAKVRTITLDFEDLQPPSPTGVEAVDKRKLSGFKSKITRKQNDIIDLMENGLISEEEGQRLILQLEELKNAASGGTSTRRKVKISTTKFKAPSVKAVKAPKIKITPPKTSPFKGLKLEAPAIEPLTIRRGVVKIKPVGTEDLRRRLEQGFQQPRIRVRFGK